MPYPTQVTREGILKAAGEMIECGDVESLSLAQLAHRLDIKPPSLYRYFASKSALLDALRLDTLTELTRTQDTGTLAGDDAASSLLTLSRRYRAYALAHPRRYLLAFSTSYGDNLAQETLLLLALPLQDLVSKVTPQDSLSHLRGLWALIHGFAMLEIGQMFQRGGDLDAGFEHAVRAYLSGMTRTDASSGD